MISSPLTSKMRSWLFLAGTVVALILIAAGLANFKLAPGEPFPYALLFGESDAGEARGPALFSLPGSLLELLATLGLCFSIIILLLWIITFIIRPQARRRMLRHIVTYMILLLVFYSMLNFVQELSPPAPDNREGTGDIFAETAPPETPLPEPPAFVVTPPAWLAGVITMVVLSLILGLVWRLWQRRSLRHLPLSPRPPLDQLAREAQIALEQLNRGSNFRDSILQCYQAMSRILAEERGAQRAKAMTARDFEAYLRESGLYDEHIYRLSRLFEKVRYSPQTPAPSEEAEAIDCLAAIVRSYGGPA